MSARIHYDASSVNLNGLTSAEIRSMNEELRTFMNGLFERYGLEVQTETNEVDARTGITKVEQRVAPQLIEND